MCSYFFFFVSANVFFYLNTCDSNYLIIISVVRQETKQFATNGPPNVDNMHLQVVRVQ